MVQDSDCRAPVLNPLEVEGHAPRTQCIVHERELLSHIEFAYSAAFQVGGGPCQ